MVYREEKSKDYTVISNGYLKDNDLSLKAKGLLTLMLSLPDDWVYSTIGLSMITKESKNTIHSILHELEKLNYLKRYKIRNKSGKFLYWNYDIYEKPYHNIRDMDYPDMENEPLLNTNILNTNNKDKKDKTLKLNFITKELVKRNFIDEYSLDIVKYNQLFNEIVDEYELNTILVVINYVISRMKDRQIDEDGNPILDRYLYFKNALISNLKKLTKEYDEFWYDSL